MFRDLIWHYTILKSSDGHNYANFSQNLEAGVVTHGQALVN